MTDPLQHVLAAARGDEPADLLITGGRVVNLFTREVEETEVAIAGGRVVGFGPHEATAEHDVDGGFVLPGYLDPHVHLESAMVTPRELARAVVPRGTSTVVTDAHEIANVHGVEGVEWMLKATEGLPLDVFFMLPSCVPATPLETSGAELTAHELARWVDHPRVLGLGEVMNIAGAIGGDAEVLAKIRASRGRVDGHAVGLTGHSLETYLAAGVESDHEATTLAEGLERVRLGMHVMVREGTTERNLAALLPMLHGPAAERCMFCTDDRHPHDLLGAGHLDDVLRQAVAGGLDPLVAIRLATRLPARYFELHRRGAIAPGFVADVVVVGDLERFEARRVYKRGRLVARDGELCVDLPPAPPAPGGSVSVTWGGLADLRVPAPPGSIVRAIRALPDQILTIEERVAPAVVDGLAVSDAERDLLKMAVVERHHGSGRVGVGFVRGFGLRAGALASSVAHDSHNLIAVGLHDEDIAAAIDAVAELGGGLAVVVDGAVRAALPLPVAGLMSDRPLAEVVAGLEALLAQARALGGGLPDPFMTLSFLALAPVPALRLTDRGLVDGARFEHVPLFVEEAPCSSPSPPIASIR